MKITLREYLKLSEDDERARIVNELEKNYITNCIELDVYSFYLAYIKHLRGRRFKSYGFDGSKIISYCSFDTLGSLHTRIKYVEIINELK